MKTTCNLFCTGARGNPLVLDALARAHAPFRPKTVKNYSRQFKLYLSYAIYVGATHVLSVTTLLGFLELLHKCHVTPKTVANYISGIKGYLTVHGLPFRWMEHIVVANYMRSLYITVPSVRRVKYVLTLQDIHNISKMLDRFDNPLQYRAAFLLSYYAFCAFQIWFQPHSSLLTH